MKKIIFAVVFCLLTASLVGCDEIKETNASISETAEETTSDQSPEEELNSHNREINTDTDFVFDDAGILSDGEYDSLNTYTARIAETFKINAAVVITDDIGGKSPSEFAEEYYAGLYSEDGILFLLNNDTGNDYFYRKGVPAKFITAADIEMLFAEISPWIVTGDYIGAAERVLETAELKLPEYITDRTGLLEKEEISGINSILKDAAGESSLNVFLVSSTGEQTTEDYAKAKFSQYYDSDSDSAMLVINISDSSSYVCASGNMTYLTDSQADIQAAVKAGLAETDSENNFICKSAVNRFLEFIQ